MPALFTEDFHRKVARLRIVAKQTPPGGRHAEHRSANLGAGMEFRDFRAYVPGDDLRRLDLNLYRRSGRLFLRLFEEPRDLAVHVLLDLSDSMFFETPPRADAGRLMAGIVLAAALNQHDRAELHPFGADLLPAVAGKGGRPAFLRALDYLERARPAGPTDFGRSLRRFGAVPRRRGLAVVISDFFDGRGSEAIIEALRGLRHRLLLVQLVRAVDAAPALDGELTLVDCETGAGVDVTVTSRVRARYVERYRRFNEALLGFAARRRCAFLRLDADKPVFGQLGRLFRDGVMVT